MKIHRKLNKTYRFRSDLKKLLEKADDDDCKEKLKKHITRANQRVKRLKDLLYIEFSKNTSVRNLNEVALHKRNIISVFDSVLTRTLGMKQNVLSEDILVVQTYFFDILKDIIINGFLLRGEKYVCFTASAGQIRTKKTVFIKESIWLKYQNSLTCGLTTEHINEKGGVNINKYLAYLALCNSATDAWTDFDINKAIVVEDMETLVHSEVDFIDEQTYEIDRKEMDILINHTDGCGMILPRRSKKSMMVRLPWIKGLLVPFPFDKFIREENKKVGSNNYGKVTDIYGKEHDLIKDDIEVIFTKSQFKMHKYYDDWQQYKDNYIKYNSQAGKCNEEESNPPNAKINYQMLQTLADMTDSELKAISEKTINSIVNIGKDKNTMLKVLGVMKENTNKNYLQQALEIYPELLNDTYSREILKNVKRSLVKEGRAGKLDIEGKYTFICPDLYAYCQWLILGIENPTGLLANGDVSCRLYKNEPKLDCLRSPHLYLEHAVRNNVVDKEKARWFITNGVYTSVHDPISKILMFDVDGDKSLVCADHTIIEVAERNMEGIVPLFYNMAVAGKGSISNDVIYNGLKAAYTGGNIGVISNNITKIWNSTHIDLNAIKWLCMENNFVIDYAKTLYKVKRPKQMGKILTEYTRCKTPHFFIYAKDKTKHEVEKSNQSVVNRLEKIIPNPVIRFKSLGQFDYKMLMSNSEVELNQQIIDKYNELDVNSRFLMSEHKDGVNNYTYIYNEIRTKLLEICKDMQYVTDVLIQYLYNHKKSNFKTTLWECFGDVILGNLNRNVENKLKDRIQCEVCGERIAVAGNRKKYCDACAKRMNIEKTMANRKKCLK
jgi:hypothetical protein